MTSNFWVQNDLLQNELQVNKVVLHIKVDEKDCTQSVCERHCDAIKKGWKRLILPGAEEPLVSGVRKAVGELPYVYMCDICWVVILAAHVWGQWFGVALYSKPSHVRKLMARAQLTNSRRNFTTPQYIPDDSLSNNTAYEYCGDQLVTQHQLEITSIKL